MKRKIHETVESVFSLSKIEDDNRVVSNPYGAIQTILDSPDFKARLDVASNEIKKRFVSI